MEPTTTTTTLDPAQFEALMSGLALVVFLLVALLVLTAVRR